MDNVNNVIMAIRSSEPMKYNSLPTELGPMQKKKMEQVLNGNDYFASLKKDGIFSRVSKIDENDIAFQSRTISKKTNDYTRREQNVPHLVNAINQLLPNGTAVVGEIYLEQNGSISSDVGSILNCLPAKSIQRQEQEEFKLHYYIFDVLSFFGQDIRNMAAIDRIDFLRALKVKIQNENIPYITIAEPVINDFSEIVSEWIAQGEEGGVLYHRQSKYISGRSPRWQTIKIKKTLSDTVDLVVMDFTPPTKNYTGMLIEKWLYWENIKTGELVEDRLYKTGDGYRAVSEYYFKNLPGGMKLGAYYEGNLLEVTTVANLTDELRYAIKENPEEYLGRVAKVSAMEITDSKAGRSLRHPKFIAFHNDKNPEECLYEEIFNI